MIFCKGLRPLYPIFFVTIFFVASCISAVSAADTTAIRAVSKMLGSLSHVKTLDLEGELVKRSRSGTATMNYHLYAEGDTKTTVAVTRPAKVTYVKNRKGFFVVSRGDISPSPEAVFPVEVPTAMFRGMTVGDVTDNYKFMVNRQSSADIVVDMIPVGTGGRSIKETYARDRVTMLRFTIGYPYYTLNRLEIFKNNALKSQDYIEAKYEILPNKVLVKKGWLKNTYRSEEMLMMTYVKSYAEHDMDNGEKDVQIKEQWYRNIKINEPIDPDRFDEGAW